MQKLKNNCLSKFLVHSNKHINFRIIFLLIVLALTKTVISSEDLKMHQIYEQALPSIVKIYKTDQFGNMVSGSGFIYDEYGSIVTNYHVIRNAKALKILHLKYKQDYTNIYIIAVDAIRDIALIRPNNFKGFIDSKGNIDAEVSPIIRKDYINDEDIIPIGHSILALTNPAGLLNIYTEGIVSGHNIITRIVKERKDILESNELYKVILFTSRIASGSSGGLLLNAKTGEAVGIAVGSAGKKEFIGFGIPLTYVNKLINEKGKSPGIPLQNFHWSEVERENDPYYNTSLYQWKDEEISAYSISGLVLTIENRPICQARVRLIGKDKELNKSIAHTLPVVTEEDGRFQLNIPRKTGLDWQVFIDHVCYQANKFGPFGLVEDFQLYYTLYLRKEFIQPAVVFKAEPDIIALELGSKPIRLKSYEQDQVVKEKILEWKLLDDDEWINVDPKSGISHQKGQRVALKCLSSKISDKEIDNVFTEISFIAFEPKSDVIIDYAFVEVYANKIIDDDFITISGTITADGAVPKVPIFITPYVDGRAIKKSVRLSEDGDFSFDLSRQFSDKIIKLNVNASIFFVHDDDPSLLIDLTQKKHTDIKLYPKQ